MGDLAVRLGGSVIRDYDRPVSFSNGKCWICNATGRKALIEPATVEQHKAKKVPVGASLCAECAFLTDEELAALVVTEADVVDFAEKKGEHAFEVRESMKENIRQWDREENLWGGA